MGKIQFRWNFETFFRGVKLNIEINLRNSNFAFIQYHRIALINKFNWKCMGKMHMRNAFIPNVYSLQQQALDLQNDVTHSKETEQPTEKKNNRPKKANQLKQQQQHTWCYTVHIVFECEYSTASTSAYIIYVTKETHKKQLNCIRKYMKKEKKNTNSNVRQVWSDAMGMLSLVKQQKWSFFSSVVRVFEEQSCDCLIAALRSWTV